MRTLLLSLLLVFTATLVPGPARAGVFACATIPSCSRR